MPVRLAKLILFTALCLSARVGLMAPPVEAAHSPLQVIQSGTERALEIIRAQREGRGPSIRQRRAEILDIVDDYFDFHEMAKRALGRPWKDQPPEKQKEFVRLFKEMLFNNYVDRVEQYTGSGERFVFDKEEIEGEYGYVKTRILNYKNTQVSVDYRLRADRNGWKAYDVIIEGISLINNYRGQFNSILASSSFDELLRKMRDKVAMQSRRS